MQLEGEHAYAYALHNPTTYIDPEGASPVRGSGRPVYGPGYWSSPGIFDNNNCWSYACNRPITGMPPGFKPQPGGPGCITSACSCANVMACVKREPGIWPWKGKHCPPGTHTVILFVTSQTEAQYGGCDYHWIRLDSNGSWSMKCGSDLVGPQFSDPYQVAGAHGYDVACQVYCVKDPQK
jgi:hypothetical protein